MLLQDFSCWLAETLTPEKYRDYCPKGLCVEAGEEVTRVVTGVSFRESLIDAAIQRGADCLVVHHPHGFWNNEARLPIGTLGRKVQKLMEHHISLFGFHLPLDGHPELGNNAQIAKALGLRWREGFMKEGDAFVGYIGELDAALPVSSFMDRLEPVFEHGVGQAFLHGKKDVRTVAICSGGGSSGIAEAIQLGADIYITGEIKEQTPILLDEEHFNLVACGHHRTEIFGVRALAAAMESQLHLPADFVDLDNPV